MKQDLRAPFNYRLITNIYHQKKTQKEETTTESARRVFLSRQQKSKIKTVW